MTNNLISVDETVNFEKFCETLLKINNISSFLKYLNILDLTVDPVSTTVIVMTAPFYSVMNAKEGFSVQNGKCVSQNYTQTIEYCVAFLFHLENKGASTMEKLPYALTVFIILDKLMSSGKHFTLNSKRIIRKLNNNEYLTF
jgi:hypothetical protein